MNNGHNKTNKRILFVINSLAGGGAERVFTTLIEGSFDRASRFEIAVALLDDDEEAYELPDWVTVFRLDSRHSLRRSQVAIRKLVKKWRPDVALAFLTRANVVTIRAMRSFGRSVLISERVNTSAHFASGRAAALSRFLVRRYYPRADRIIGVSQGVNDTLNDDFGVPESKMSVVYNPVDIDSIRRKAAETPSLAVESDDIVAMGRLVPNKNFSLAIRAFAKSSHPGRLIILGDGPERDNLAQLAHEQGVADRVLMPGFQSNPYAIMAHAGLFLLSSNAEGFSNALVEAMAVGMPIVATDCRSSPAEILEAKSPEPGQYMSGRGGLLVPVDDVAAMASAISALENENLRRELTNEGACRVGDFTVQRAIKGFWSAIDEQLMRVDR